MATLVKHVPDDIYDWTWATVPVNQSVRLHERPDKMIEWIDRHITCRYYMRSNYVQIGSDWCLSCAFEDRHQGFMFQLVWGR